MKKKKIKINKKKMITSIIVVVIIGILIYPVIKNNVSDKLSSHKHLTVYLVSTDAIQRTLVSAYESHHPDVTVKEVEFDDYDSYNKKLNADLLSGKGPDVIWANQGQLDRFYKIIDSGVFLDLNDIIKKDKEFNAEEYNKGVMNAGKFDGKQLIIPYDYYVSTYVSTEDAMKKSGLDINSKQKFKTTVNQSLDYYSKKGKKPYFANINISYTQYLNYMGDKFIDYDKKEVRCDTKKFRNDMKALKEINKKNDGINKMSKEYDGDFVQVLKNNKILLANSYGDVDYLFYFYKELKNQGHKLVYEGTLGQNSASIVSFMGINSNSQNVKEAFDFIKLGVSADFHKNGLVTHDGDFSVNVGNNNMLLGKVIESNSDVNDEYISGIISNYADDINKIKKADIVDSQVEGIIYNNMTPYFKGKKDLDECVKKTQKELEIYIEE